MQTNNTTALGVVNKNFMKKLKSMDLKYHWLRCQISQEQFRHYWASGKTNLGDYVTKHHPEIHHQATRSSYLTDISKLIVLKFRQKNYAKTITSCSNGVLDRSGLPNTAGNYKKTLEDRKLLNVTHSDRQEHAKAQLLSEPLRQRSLLAMSA